MSNIRLFPNERTAKLLGKGTTAFLMPWKEQPPEGWNKFLSSWQPPGKPCNPGDALYICEAWEIHGSIHQYYVHYLAGGRHSKWIPELDSWREKKGWIHQTRSPVTMPNIACRRVWNEWTIEAIQDDVNFQRVISLGHDNLCDFKVWLSTAYPNHNLDDWFWLIMKRCFAAIDENGDWTNRVISGKI